RFHRLPLFWTECERGLPLSLRPREEHRAQPVRGSVGEVRPPVGAAALLAIARARRDGPRAVDPRAKLENPRGVDRRPPTQARCLEREVIECPRSLVDAGGVADE